MTLKLPAALALAAATLAFPAHAQFAKPEDAIKYRKASLSVMGTHFSRLGAMANGRVPFDAKVAAENAALVDTLAKLPWDAFGPGTDWDLPYRWRTPPAGLDLGTPLNFVSTADTYGGNSGSPAIRPDLSLVGLNFDRNMEGLSRDFIYLPERGRNIMVDARAILAALDHAYDLDRIARELVTGRVFATEAEADAAAVAP